MTATKRPRKRKGDHVVILPGRGGALFCRHCAETYAPTLPARMSVITATWNAFTRAHSDCALTERGLACGYCLDFGHEPAACLAIDPQGDPDAWLRGPDTGLSSKTIWSVMMNASSVLGQWGPHTPIDPGDFGCCYRLLAAFPGWRARLGEMGKVGGWRPLVDAWDELERLWEEESPSGACPRLYARMRELRGER